MGSDAAINAHLLFSPDEPDHLDRTRRLLATFTFRYPRHTAFLPYFIVGCRVLGQDFVL